MSSTDDLRGRLKALCQALPGQGEGTEREVLAVYLLACSDIPPGFVVSACDRFIKGLVERNNPQFRPTPPELAIEARRLSEIASRRQQFATLPAPSERRGYLGEPRQPFIPFPRLWAALGDDDREILRRLTFDKSAMASLVHATEGLEAARAYLRQVGGISPAKAAAAGEDQC